MAKKRDTLEVLAEHGLILKGTTIELLPTKRGERDNLKAFQATFESTLPRTKSVRWALDDCLYTLTGLTKKMNEGGYVTQQNSMFFKNWRRTGHDHSLWEEAEKFDR